jgi:hypothetical protein
MIVRGRSIGLRIERHPAECLAVLEDAEGGSIGLWFLTTDRDGKQIPASQGVVGGRQSVSGCLFARPMDESHSFAYQAMNNEGLEPKIPPVAARYTDAREFTPRIHVINGSTITKVPVKVRRSMDGNL